MDIAIVGMACLLPRASNLRRYWHNMLNGVDTVTEIIEDRWDWKTYYDPNLEARDTSYSKWGGFLDAVPFDPTVYGMPPKSLPSIEPLQLLTLETARTALADAGYADRSFPRERTSVILGISSPPPELALQYIFRSNLPLFCKNIPPKMLDRLAEWKEDSFPGIIANVVAGRVANRMDLRGANYTVDADNASSLACIQLAVDELSAGTSDMVITGGADTAQTPHIHPCLRKTRSLSPKGRACTLDKNADGIVIGEGIIALVLKRLVDAERDGDRIYALIKAVSGASGGKDKTTSASESTGLRRAMERAYATAGFSPSTLTLIETRGLSTPDDDREEIETMTEIFSAAGALPTSCAIGSVTSMIGHTKAASGAAGLMKVALALYHKVLPPTLGVSNPNAGLAGSPFYVNAIARPWIRQGSAPPRRGGVTASGVGGMSFHAVLEEYTGDFLEEGTPAVSEEWPAELFLWTSESREQLCADLASIGEALAAGDRAPLRDLAHTLSRSAGQHPGYTLAIVASSFKDLREKIELAWNGLSSADTSDRVAVQDPRGIYYTEQPLANEGKVAFLFPGQGSQYPFMACDLAVHFPEIRERFELVDQLLEDRLPQPLSRYVFPPSCFNRADEECQRLELTRTSITQPAIGAASMGLFRLLDSLGIKADMAAGHSYGEYTALCASGVFSEIILYELSEARGRLMMEASTGDLGTMVAVGAGPETTVNALQSLEGVWAANLNSPSQTIISGTLPGIEEAVKRLNAGGYRTTPLPVGCAFHSPLMAPVQSRFSEYLAAMSFSAPRIPVFSNTVVEPYPLNPTAIVSLLGEQLVRPVRFNEEIEAMRVAGALVYIEVGPGNVLTGLTQQILADRPHLAVALDIRGRHGIVQLLHALAQLAAHKVPMDLDRLYRARETRQLPMGSLADEMRERSLPPTTWMVNGSRAWPLQDEVEKTKRNESIDGTKVAKAADANAKPPDLSSLPQQLEDTKTIYHDKTEYRPMDHTLPHPSPPSGVAGQEKTHDVVTHEFLQLMNRFLEVQREIMLAYLGDAAQRNESSPAIGALEPASEPDHPPAFLSPYPQQHSKNGGLTSAAAVATGADTQAASDKLAARPIATPLPSSPARGESPESVSVGQLESLVLDIVSDRTGYPVEMLDLDLNIEADLGIDSIKRVEILGKVTKAVLSGIRQPDQNASEELNSQRTLRGIIDWLSRALSQH